MNMLYLLTMLMGVMILWLMIRVHVLEDKVERLKFKVQNLDDKQQQANAKQREEDLQKRLASRRMPVSDTR
jgi:hypothetical protein